MTTIFYLCHVLFKRHEIDAAWLVIAILIDIFFVGGIVIRR